MALPIAHSAVAFGIIRSRDRLVLAGAVFLSILPDLDFILVWGFGLPIQVYHRTFSHSILFSLALALLWRSFCPFRLRTLSFMPVLLILLSHGAIDMLCTSDAADHGVMLFWPASSYRAGVPVLVPVYLLVANSPFSPEGALRFLFLESFMAWPLWRFTRIVREGLLAMAARHWDSKAAVQLKE